MEENGTYEKRHLIGTWMYTGNNEFDGLKIDVAESEEGGLVGRVMDVPCMNWDVNIGDIWWKKFSKRSGDSFYSMEAFVRHRFSIPTESAPFDYLNISLRFLNKRKLERTVVDPIQSMDPVVHYVKIEEAAEAAKKEAEEEEKMLEKVNIDELLEVLKEEQVVETRLSGAPFVRDLTARLWEKRLI